MSTNPSPSDEIDYGPNTMYGKPTVARDGRYLDIVNRVRENIGRWIKVLIWISVVLNCAVVVYGLLMQHEHIQVTDGSISCMLD
jgi:hypothetical protein